MVRFPPRRAFTLLEVLLVLGVLVLVAGVAWPNLARTFDNQKLRRAGEAVRAELARARNEAMKTGQIIVFRGQLAGGRYEVRPFSQNVDVLEAAASLTEPERLVPADAAALELPADIVFENIETHGGRKTVPATELEAGADLPANWSPPILFYADGTSSHAALTLRNRLDYLLVVELRGLTGTCQTSDLRLRQELAHAGP